MKVLLPIDGSAAANDAVGFVKELASNRDVEVVVLTVSYDPAHYSMQPWVPEWTEHENLRTKSILENAIKQLDGTCRSVTTIHGSGATVPCILDNAASLKADLIVMGAKGHSAVRRIFLGSVSDSVATSAKCSVVVVRSHPESKSYFEKIVLGFDQSAASREAVAELAEWHLPSESSVKVVSVAMQPHVYAGENYLGMAITMDPRQVDRLDEAAERMASQIADHFHHTTVMTPTAAHVGEAIIDAAEQDNAGLVIVGDTGHSLLGEWLLGSTSKYVLHHAPCSVWISRHHWSKAEETPEVGDAVAAS